MTDSLNPFIASPSGTGPNAILFLYSPRMYDTQVLRPFVYGFTDGAVNKLLGAADTMTGALGRSDIIGSEEVASCIKPDTNGVSIDMQTMSALWTFTLVITRPNDYAGTVMFASGYRTTIMTGQCLDEPVNQFGTPNPDCHLQVHSRQVLRTSQPSVGLLGARSPTQVLCADDILDPSLNMCAPTKDLYLLTPYTVLSNYDGVDMPTTTPQLCALSTLNKRNPVQSALKTPGVHLKQIVQGLDTQNREASAEEYSPNGMSSMGAMYGADDIQQYKEGLINKYSQASFGTAPQTDGLDATDIFTIGEVDRMYNGGLKVQVQHVAPTAQYEVVPQTILNPKVMYSSLISSSISAIAADVGLSSISFAYTSYDPMKSSDLIKSTFQVVADDAYLTCPPQDPEMLKRTLMGAVEMFKVLFEKNVAPFIIPVVGNFEVMARYSVNGECQVNLKLLDFNMNTNLSDTAFMETPMRLSGLTTTSVGSIDTFNNNGQSLNSLMLLTQGKTQANAMGLPAFSGGHPIEDAPIPAMDYSSIEGF